MTCSNLACTSCARGSGQYELAKSSAADWMLDGISTHALPTKLAVSSTAYMRIESLPQQVERVIRAVEGAFTLTGEDAGEYLEGRAEAWGEGDEPESGTSGESAFNSGLRSCAG